MDGQVLRHTSRQGLSLDTGNWPSLLMYPLTLTHQLTPNMDLPPAHSSPKQLQMHPPPPPPPPHTHTHTLCNMVTGSILNLRAPVLHWVRDSHTHTHTHRGEGRGGGGGGGRAVDSTPNLRLLRERQRTITGHILAFCVYTHTHPPTGKLRGDHEM